MSKIIGTLFFGLCLSSIAWNASAANPNCPKVVGNYGDKKSFQNIGCRIMVGADETDSQTNRNVILNSQGLIQVFNNFPGTTNSNSTGARVYFILPYRTADTVIKSYNKDGLVLSHRSGVDLAFNKNGRLSSPDIDIKVDNKINSQNRGGIEIQKYNKGLVLDLGWRMGNSPIQNPDAPVKVTDKLGKMCTFLNSELHSITKYGADLKYTTNSSFHAFLSKKCPKLDLSDLKNPELKDLSAQKINENVLPPKNDEDSKVNDTSRASSKQNEIQKLFERVKTEHEGRQK